MEEGEGAGWGRRWVQWAGTGRWCSNCRNDLGDWHCCGICSNIWAHITTLRHKHIKHCLLCSIYSAVFFFFFERWNTCCLRQFQVRTSIGDLIRNQYVRCIAHSAHHKMNGIVIKSNINKEHLTIFTRPTIKNLQKVDNISPIKYARMKGQALIWQKYSANPTCF